jgi:hypothetical protein
MFYALSFVTVSAQTNYYGWVSGNTIEVIDAIQKDNNVVYSRFEQRVRDFTADGVVSKTFGPQNRIANGTVLLIEAISPYIQWIIFFGMSLSVIMIIYNGFLIVTDPGGDKTKSAKENIKNIVLGVLVLGGFYFIMRVVSGLLLKLIGG